MAEEMRPAQTANPFVPAASGDEPAPSAPVAACSSIESALIVNPRLTVLEEVENTLLVLAPVKGESMRVNTITKSDEAETFGLLKQLSTNKGGPAPAMSDGLRSRLTTLGVLLCADKTPDSVWFSCYIQDPPLRLIPPTALGSLKEVRSAEAAIVNPSYRYLDVRSWSEVVTEQIAGGNDFLCWGSWVWVEQTRASLPSIYSVPRGERSLFSSLVAGSAPPDSLDEETRRELSRAGIIVTRDDLEQWRVLRRQGIAAASDSFKQSRYVVLSDLLHPFQIGALRRYYRVLVEEGYLQYGDDQVPCRYAIHSEPLGCFLHRQLTGLVSEIVREPVKPSYVYFAGYRAGSVLRKHTDREQCEFTLSLLIDYEPEPEGVSPWPLLVDVAADKTASIDLRIGDGLLFKGRELAHHREMLPEGHSSSSLFFHFVPQSYEGPLE